MPAIGGAVEPSCLHERGWTEFSADAVSQVTSILRSQEEVWVSIASPFVVGHDWVVESMKESSKIAADDKRAGDDRLVIVLYDRLRSLARARMSGQPPAHTLDATGLANEAVLRLMKVDPATINDEQHFLALAAETMRQILVDHARAKRAAKRGGGQTVVPILGEADLPVRLRSEPEDVLALSDALSELERDDAEAATIVKMRAFAGMDPEEIAALLGVSKRTIERRWRFAMADLRTRMGDGPDEVSDGAADDGRLSQ